MFIARGSQGWLVELSDLEMQTLSKLLDDKELTDFEEELLDKLGRVMFGVRQKFVREKKI